MITALDRVCQSRVIPRSNERENFKGPWKCKRRQKMITDKVGRAHFVIDQHVHVGMRPARSTTASSSYLPDELIANMDANGVDMVVGFPKANPHTDYRIENERIISAMKQHPTRIVAFARINPYFGANAVACSRLRFERRAWSQDPSVARLLREPGQRSRIDVSHRRSGAAGKSLAAGAQRQFMELRADLDRRFGPQLSQDEFRHRPFGRLRRPSGGDRRHAPPG